MRIFVGAVGLAGTEFDITDSDKDFSGMTVFGKFTEDDGKITGGSMEYVSEEEGESVTYRLFFSVVRDVEFPSVPSAE